MPAPGTLGCAEWFSSSTKLNALQSRVVRPVHAKLTNAKMFTFALLVASGAIMLAQRRIALEPQANNASSPRRRIKIFLLISDTSSALAHRSVPPDKSSAQLQPEQRPR